MQRKYLVILFTFFLLAYVLRVLFLSQNVLIFGYDQARDIYHALEIAHGHLKILGPPASTPGLFHGVLYYYLLVPVYLAGRGNPIVAAYWIALLNASTIFVIFYLAFLLTKKIFPALLASFLFAISFEATQYATWLANATLGILTVPLFYLGLWIWTKEKRKKLGAIVCGLGLGLSVQSEIFLLYQTVPLGIWLWFNRKKIKRDEVVYFVSTFLISVSTMILAEIKFGFRGIGGFLSLASASDSVVASRGLGDFVTLYLNQLGRVVADNIYPGNVGYAGFFVLILLGFAIYSWKKKKDLSWQPFLGIWILSHIMVTTVGGSSAPHLTVGIGSAVLILVAISLYNFWSKNYKKLVVIISLIIIFGNISTILRENWQGAIIFAVQKDMLLNKQLQAVDYTYNQSSGRPFSINSLTSPLWINVVWTYLYKWYGQPKYGYVPTWHGRDQAGIIDSLSVDNKKTNDYFLIIEPMGGIPMRYLDETIGEENVHSKLIEDKYFGELRVQKRIRI